MYTAMLCGFGTNELDRPTKVWTHCHFLPSFIIEIG
ncbi:Uncharacterized protein APZ42_026755 [Daphnia magna]|uniref:Uncharacterized protein n=1 Tax=Daphnia magna TaxID=35525 RepID=A0A164RWM8_9CRUS|nr:Uncharacterized protein APZ42_026755 [Daphnia magna]